MFSIKLSDASDKGALGTKVHIKDCYKLDSCNWFLQVPVGEALGLHRSGVKKHNTGDFSNLYWEQNQITGTAKNNKRLPGDKQK